MYCPTCDQESDEVVAYLEPDEGEQVTCVLE